MLKKIFSDDSGTFDPVGVTRLPLVIKSLTLRTPTPPADRERLDQFPDLVLGPFVNSALADAVLIAAGEKGVAV
jgi:hypothetical protein